MMNISPGDYAQALVEFLDLKQPFEFDKSLLSELGLQWREVPSIGFDGALVRRPGEARGIIAVRKTIPEPVSKRFTIAHEIGHYVLPGHDVDFAVCTEEDVSLLRENVGEFEQEANQFAAELLLPAEQVKKIVKDRGTSMDTCKFISKAFDTSLTAAAVRCIELSDTVAALVETRNRVVRRYRRSDRWKYFITTNKELGSESLAKQLSVAGERETVGRVPAWAWIRIQSDWEIMEHSIFMPRYNTILTLLTEV
jgi:Zn-dependent peptidase ImmA (M78 family)